MRLGIGGAGSAQGANAFFQNQAEQQYRNFFVQQQLQKAAREKMLFDQSQAAQQSAGNAVAGMLAQPPAQMPPPQGNPMTPGPGASVMAGAAGTMPPAMAPQGPLPPPPGQSSQPMARPAVPMMPVPQQIPPYKAMPQPGAQPTATPSAPGALPPPPAAQQQVAQPQPTQFTFENVAQALTAQGLKGGELWRALNEVAPRMDAQYRQQLQAMNQEIAMLRVQTGIQAQQTRAQQTERRLDQGDKKIEETGRHDRTVEALTEKLRNDPKAMLDPDDLKFMAQQYRAGDASVMQNIGRGVQGSKNIVALRHEIRKQSEEAGESAPLVAARIAEFAGFKAGQRTLASRQANIEMASTEASGLAQLALKASNEWQRSGVKSLNDLYKYAEGKTASPELRKFVAANTSFINAYARAINPQGVGTVADKEHAIEMLQVGFAKGDYAAAIKQLQQEIATAKASPGQVKEDMRRSFTGGAGTPSGTLPAGIPAGSNVIGKTPQGADVYQSPDGKRWTQ